MAVINYQRFRQRLQQVINSDPSTVTFYGEGGIASDEFTGRLAPAGSRSFGRLNQSGLAAGVEPVGKQQWVIELPYDTALPTVGEEARTMRQEVEQRFSVIMVMPSPWKIEVILDELR